MPESATDLPPRPARDPAFLLRPLAGGDFERAVALQHEVWGAGFAEAVPGSLLRVVPYVGGVSVGAFTRQGELAGFLFGVSGVRDGRLAHWSDILAVRPPYRNRGLGEDLKWYQRDLLVPLGVERIFWTFDPLESRNAWLNFNRLGAVAREYRRDVYGASGSDLHAGIDTDRLIVEWGLATPRVEARRHGGSPALATPEDAAAAPLVNASDAIAGEVPETRAPDLGLDAPKLRIAIPSDVQALKARALDAARAWREVTRAAFETYLPRGYEVRALRRAGATSEYLLERAPSRTA